MQSKLLLPLIQDSCELKIIKDKAYEVKSESGMTLIEVIIVMVLVGILSGFISKIIYYEINTYEMIADRKDELQSSRYAFHRIIRDIRHIMTPDTILHASSDSLSFHDVDDILIVYKYKNNEIFRNGDILVDGLTNFYFTYYDDANIALSSPVTDPSEIMVIELHLSNTVHSQIINSQIKVTPRNFLNDL